MHHQGIMEHDQIRLQILALLGRSIDPVKEDHDMDTWSAVRIPSLKDDAARIWQVFRKWNLSTKIRTSATVALDDRKSRKRLAKQLRIKCHVCPSSAESRGICVHERMCLPHITEEQARIGDTEDEDLLHQRNDSSDDEERVLDAKITAEPPICYASTMSRNFFPCKSDENPLSHVIQMISSRTRPGNQSSAFRDGNIRCNKCQLMLNGGEMESVEQRSTTLHTLHHGSVDVIVEDVRCSSCCSTVPYDGFDDALFCSFKTNVFTRELLDYWLHGVCATGWTLRDAFTAWMRACGSCTAYLEPSTRQRSIQ